MDKVSNIPPQHPKGGQIFLISDGNNKARQNNWSCDGYPWVNKGGYGVPKKNPIVFARQYTLRQHSGDLKGCEDFIRRAYFIKDSPFKLVHYVGDESKYVPRPHGNQKDQRHGDYRRTLPSVLHRGRLWQEFNGHELTFKEKTDIKFDKKLCCQTMNFCQSVTKSQFPCITGFQNTWRVPVLENKKWIYQHKMRSQPSPSVQIHHTGCDHWITSCQDPNGTIYVLDSMNGKTLTTSVQIQMSMIYGKGKTVVPVKIPNVQQQKNSIDCGVFAIVFMVEFCFNNFIGRDNVNFDTYTMRDHLIKCIESQQFSPFPKTKPTRTKVLSLKNTSVNFSIEKECTARCNLPNLFEDMVCCDRCSAWYHYGCVPSNNSNTFSGSLSFTCSNCSSTP
jgi:hypothetical protein